MTLDELAQTWWGEDPGPTAAQRATLAELLRSDTRYFSAAPPRPDTYRTRSRAQVALAARRQAQMAAYGDLSGRWLLVRNAEGATCVARVVAVAVDHALVEEAVSGAGADALSPVAFLVWPEEMLGVLEGEDQAAAALARMATALQSEGGAAVMEPNQALAAANQQFPAAARLRRTGYRLADRVLVLTFDFPDVAQVQFAAALDDLAARTGWQIEVTPEANQGALNALVAECLPEGWRIQKGPSIHRSERRVAVAVADRSGPGNLDPDQLAAAQERYAAISGYALEISLAAATPHPVADPMAASGSRLEINAAYALIKQALADSSLYRTSLKEDAIVLSFISPQVGERYRAEIEQLARQVGWPLRIHTQPNQGAIVDTARRLLQQRGWTAVKGPSIYPERSEVAVTLAEPPASAEGAAVQAEFVAATGYRLVFVAGAAGMPAVAPDGTQAAAPSGAASSDVVELPIAQVRLQRVHEGMALNPAKLENAIERARRHGQVNPPIAVRRLRDGYLLLDGLYRLRAAQSLGHTRILAVIER